ncbi:hypothetical protein N7G274_001901 [Stereocaulon virgatum]|uniref:Uncharacterized protein n=1 Tax=Stereocaulon virgatum TaxID=373712 RepID=A0ABR4APW2_9LECA
MDQPKIRGTNQAPSAQQTTAEPNHEPEKQDIFETWDDPVWDSGYGRFQSQEDAAADDHKDLALQRCEGHQCNCRAPFQDRS